MCASENLKEKEVNTRAGKERAPRRVMLLNMYVGLSFSTFKKIHDPSFLILASSKPLFLTASIYVHTYRYSLV